MTRNKMILLLCAFLLSSIGFSQAAHRQSTSLGESRSKEVDVYLLAGQSNMEGVGRVERLATSALDSPNVHLFHSAALGAEGNEERWLPLCPAGWKGTFSGGFGVELSLGAALSAASPKRQIYLVKHAVGGSSLFDAWHPQGGREFIAFESLIKRALSELKSQGLRPVVRGVFWQQGEADAKTIEMARVYERRLENLIVRMRDHWAIDVPAQCGTKIRFVLGQVIPDATPGSQAEKSYPYRELVRAAQLSVSNALSNVVTVATDASFETHASELDGYRDEDNIHFNEAGLTKLGEQMAAAYLKREDWQSFSPRKTLLSDPIKSSDSETSGTPGVLRVATYNSYYVFSEGKEVTTATKWIVGQGLDLLALQELTNITDERLVELAAGWGHTHSALLKTSGFSVGLTSVHPIETIERMTEGLHHGCLHARVAGVHVFVVHLSPFKWSTREAEAQILLAEIEPLLEQGADVLVMGDFNCHSPVDRPLLATQPSLLQKAIESDAAHSHVKNLREGQFDFAVMQSFLGADLTDAALPFLKQARGLRWTIPTGYWDPSRDTPPANGTRIDYVLASKSMAISAVSAFTPREGVVNQTSDHYPVLVEFHRPSW